MNYFGGEALAPKHSSMLNLVRTKNTPEMPLLPLPIRIQPQWVLKRFAASHSCWYPGGLAPPITHQPAHTYGAGEEALKSWLE